MSQVPSNNDHSFIISNSFNPTTPVDEAKILAWLSPLEPWVRHRDIGSQRIDSVGSWVLETEEFRRWHNGSGEDGSDHAALFCAGDAGVGKSSIISLVIDKLCEEAMKEDFAVAYFYFDFASRNEQSPINMLGSLLRQLVSGLGEIPEPVIQSFRDEEKVIGGRRLQVSAILGMLQAITAIKLTFICVDALDECVPEHRMVVLKSLGQILQGSANSRIFMTGRAQVRGEVERELGRAASFILIKPTEDGIVRYLHEKLRNDTTPEIMNSALEANILRSIPEISSETFLLASLHIGAVLRGATIARRGQRLRLMKDMRVLGDVYGATLERIQAQGVEKAKIAIATLTWICHSERPLQVDELCHALAVDIGITDFDVENVPSIDTLIGSCQGLIAVDTEASTVRLIHFTVQEYLCAQPHLFSKPHSVISEACLTYLNSQQVKSLSFYPLPDHEGVPFLQYSSRYWGVHANREPSDHAMTLALELLNRYEDHVSAVSLLMQVLPARDIGGTGTSTLFSGLHCVSFFGIVELATALTDTESFDINQQDCTGSTPLSWATRQGHDGVVKLLLERENFGSNCLNTNGRTPLGCVAIGGHEGVAGLLLGREDVDPDRPDNEDNTPLSRAAESRPEGAVKLLLPRKVVDPNLADEDDRTPLGWASEKGHEEVVKLLLEQDNVDPNRPDEEGLTPLGCAAANGHEGVVKLLLGREDVEPDQLGNENNTPISLAAGWGHEGVVMLLLSREDVDPNRPDENNRTPLGWAAIFGHKGVAELLLERGSVDPDHPDENDRTPLLYAALAGHEGVVKLLLERENVDPDRPDNAGNTPLSCAAECGHEAIVRLLLGREDVDPNRSDEEHRTPLRWAAREGHEGVVKLLLGREDVDPDRPDNKGNTPLSWAAENGHERVVRLLIDRKDVDPNRPDEKHQTPLGSAARKGHEGVVKLLLGREDLEPDRPDNKDNTPLSWAAENGHEGVMRLLLERKDVDPNRPDENDRTPLGCATGNGHEGVVKLLLERGNVDLNRPDMHHRTPLGRAALNGHGGVVKLLLDRKDVDPNRADENGRTPLECAAILGHEGVAKLLLEWEHVEPNRPDQDDRTPL